MVVEEAVWFIKQYLAVMRSLVMVHASMAKDNIQDINNELEWPFSEPERIL